jgi:hypothetical protein
MRGPKKDPYGRCWWCAAPAKGRERTELWNKRTGEKRSVLLCEGCATKPERTVWLARREGEHAHTSG